MVFVWSRKSGQADGREDQTMARALRIEYPGAFYHVASRGNERRDIFLSGSDRERFLSYLDSAAVRYDARIHVYCLLGV
jgi:REP element-mobilizing transposase RayT